MPKTMATRIGATIANSTATTPLRLRGADFGLRIAKSEVAQLFRESLYHGETPRLGALFVAHEGLAFECDVVEKVAEVRNVGNDRDVAVINPGADHEQLARLRVIEFDAGHRFQGVAVGRGAGTAVEGAGVFDEHSYGTRIHGRAKDFEHFCSGICGRVALGRADASGLPAGAAKHVRNHHRVAEFDQPEYEHEEHRQDQSCFDNGCAVSRITSSVANSTSEHERICETHSSNSNADHFLKKKPRQAMG